MEALEIILQILVISGFVVFAWSEIRGQPVGETIQQIKELILRLLDNE